MTTTALTAARVVRVQNENARLRADSAQLRAAAVDNRARSDELAAEAAGLRRDNADLRREVAQLTGALDSRIVIEQAKGIVSERGHVDMAAAFLMLRRRARERNQRLHDICVAVVASAEHTNTPPWGGADAA
jgi:hypothetical protein